MEDYSTRKKTTRPEGKVNETEEVRAIYLDCCNGNDLHVAQPQLQWMYSLLGEGVYPFGIKLCLISNMSMVHSFQTRNKVD